MAHSTPIERLMKRLGRLGPFRPFAESEGLGRYFKNTSWLLLEQSTRLLVAIVGGIIVARYLGPENFGKLSFSLSLVGLLTVGASLGLETILVKEIVAGEHKLESILGTSLVLRITSSIFAVAATVLIAMSIPSLDDEEKLIAAVASLTAMFFAFEVIDYYFKALVQTRYMLYARLVQAPLSIVIKLALVIQQASVVLFAWAIVLDATLYTIVILFLFRRHANAPLLLHFRMKIAASVLSDGWPLVISAVAVSIYMKVDQLMIQSMLGMREVGIYAIAVRISELGYFFPMVVVSSLFPAMVRARQTSENDYLTKRISLYSFLVITAVALSVVLWLLAPFLVRMLFGYAYIAAADVLKIHAWAAVFVFIGIAGKAWAVSENLQVYAAINTVTGALLNVILNWVFIPRFGITGAAYATLLSYAFASILGFAFFSATRPEFLNMVRAFIFMDTRTRNSDVDE